MALEKTIEAHTDDVLRRVRKRATAGEARKPGNWRDVLSAANDVGFELGGRLLASALDRRGTVAEHCEALVGALLDAAAQLVELAAFCTARAGESHGGMSGHVLSAVILCPCHPSDTNGVPMCRGARPPSDEHTECAPPARP